MAPRVPGGGRLDDRPPDHDRGRDPPGGDPHLPRDRREAGRHGRAGARRDPAPGRAAGTPARRRDRRARGRGPPVGALDIEFYRDDLRGSAMRRTSRAPTSAFDIDGATVVLVDDVLYTGRTIRAAMDALREFGRPRAIRLAVLVDRGHRELPIRADHVGKNVPTSREEVVRVRVERGRRRGCGRHRAGRRAVAAGSAARR